MKYGYFDDKNKEYVIERPDTPRPWSNYLGSTVYGAIITNNAGGYSFYKSAARGKFLRLIVNNVPLDQPGRYIYIRDNESSDYWSTSWQPVDKDLADYKTECRHGTAYTKIKSEYSGILSETVYFVPLNKDFECWVVKIKNNSNKKRNLSCFTYTEFASHWNLQQDLLNLQYSQYIIRGRVEKNIIEASINENLPYDEKAYIKGETSTHSFISLIGANVDGFDTRRENFLGSIYNTYKNPKVVMQGKCTGSLVMGDNGCGTFQTNLDLKPGEEREFMVLLGIGPISKAKECIQEIPDVKTAKVELEKVKEYWHSRLGNLITQTPDKEFDHMINLWNAYNCLITFAWSRSASLIYQGERDGLGYRDTVQDILGVLPAIADSAGERLELMITGQYSNGGAKPVVKPFEHTPGEEKVVDDHEYRSDDCLWLFNTIPAYVKETGKLDFYNKVLPFADAGEATVFGHLRRAIEFNLQRSGAHGLACGLSADWNDCLQLGYYGESVFVTMQLRYALKEFIEIAQLLSQPEEAAWAKEKLATLDDRIQEHTWDGKWFIRAYKDDGTVYGSRKNEEGFIWLNSQSWAVLSGAASSEQARSAMDSVYEHLSTDYGIMVCAPPYQKESVEVIRAVLFNPGQKENGGIFCHPQGWAVMAEAALGNGNRAYEYYRNYMPSAYNEKAEIREIEPYVHCQSTHSKYSAMYGASRLPWLSGTAAWSYFSATQWILGIRPDYNGLIIDPAIPSDWKEFTVSRVFREKKINIKFNNPESVQKGVKKIMLNGQALEGNIIPVDLLKDVNEAEVLLG
ncbi:MAG: N,N'-diacetylchitobiose phosphorylase [Spirochaetales bacterium]|nr:N,N'-diacetylchitobiose phosphorylase [Spirochaetales bacterium]